jgi:transcriptional regulator GlxA family with amidase domain
MILNIILFQNFETLDVFGPVEIFGKLKELYQIEYYSETGGIIESSQGVKVVTQPWIELNTEGILFIPGGQGTRLLVQNNDYILRLKEYVISAKYCLTVCTGSGLLARTGLLQNRYATSNKRAFEWAISMDNHVKWLKKARWAVDGKYYTSSGVSAGMDMTLAFVADRHGRELAEEIADSIKYVWNQDKDDDVFATEGL